jgi:alkylated DNA repair dioxygenase AlkB
LQGHLDAQGNSPMYRHPADEQPPLQALTPWINRLMTHCVELLDQPLNHVLIQHYLDGMGYISPHSDKTLDITRGTSIVGLSLGATRSIILQSKRRDEQGGLRTQVLELPHGSLFVLGWDTNQEFQHGIRQDKRAEHDMQAHELRDDTQRISLTMRSVATFLTPEGELFGQGALRKRLEDTPASSHEIGDDLVEAERLLVAFGAENMQDDFDWDEVYGRGFDILDFAALRLAEEPQ